MVGLGGFHCFNKVYNLQVHFKCLVDICVRLSLILEIRPPLPMPMPNKAAQGNGKARATPAVPFFTENSGDDVKSTSSALQGIKTKDDTPTPEQISEFQLPEGYRIKFCKLCGNNSLSISEIIDPDSAWGRLLPWGNGTRNCPTGVFCRIWFHFFREHNFPHAKYLMFFSTVKAFRVQG